MRLHDRYRFHVLLWKMKSNCRYTVVLYKRQTERLKEIMSCHHKVRHCANPTTLSNGNQWQSESHGKWMVIITSDPY